MRAVHSVPTDGILRAGVEGAEGAWIVTRFIGKLEVPVPVLTPILSRRLHGGFPHTWRLGLLTSVIYDGGNASRLESPPTRQKKMGRVGRRTDKSREEVEGPDKTRLTIERAEEPTIRGETSQARASEWPSVKYGNVSTVHSRMRNIILQPCTHAHRFRWRPGPP